MLPLNTRRIAADDELKRELGELVLSFLTAEMDEQRQRCLRFIDSTLRQLIVLREQFRQGQ